MAEGTAAGSSVLKEAREDTVVVVVPDPDPQPNKEPDVQPKERKTQQRESGMDDLEASIPGGAKTLSGEWWQSSALAGPGSVKAPTSHPSDLAFQGWREQRWMEDDEGEWNYTTSPGNSTLDVLQERFGEASFWNAPSWQP